MDADLSFVDPIFFCNFTTVAFCIFIKIPQIWTLYKTQSVVGVSVLGIIIELIGYSIALTYNIVQEYPLSTYLEYIFLVGQDIVLIVYIFHLMGNLDGIKIGTGGLLSALFYGLSQGSFHPVILDVLIKLQSSISAFSKFVTLKALWTTRNSESISVLTWLISVYTCATRIVTTIMTTGDGNLLTSYFTSFLLNGIIVASALYLRKPKSIAAPNSIPKEEDKQY